MVKLIGSLITHVLYVSHWADDDTYQNETKKFKKIKADSRQLDLFNDLNIQ